MRKNYALIAAVLASTAMATGNAANVNGSNVTFYGNMIYDQSVAGNATTGIYSTVFKPCATVSQVASQVAKANGGACLADTAYFAVEYTTRYGNVYTCYLNSYNPTTWQRTNQVTASHSSIATSLTYNPVDKKIYGSFYSEEREKFYFGTINPKTADCDTIAFLDHSFNALASDEKGTLYFVNDSGDFGKISAADGAITIIGATGFSPKYLQDATFDYGTKQFYWFAFNDNDDESGIYTVDLATGKATRYSQWATGGKEFVGVCTKTPVYAAAVPEIPSEMTISYAGTSLTGTVAFTLPAATYGGEAITGNLDYEVLVDGVVKATGTAAAGGKVTLDLAVERGDHNVSARAKNAAGAGPEYICTQYFGVDVPSAVSSVSAERSADGAQVKWNAVTTGAHGAQFDPSVVTYNVVRYPDSVAVATGVKDTVCTDTHVVTNLGSYYYEVVAVDGTYKTDPAKSNNVILGTALQVPYSKTFSDGDFSLYTIVDANGDGSTWMKDLRGARYLYSNSVAADDWLIAPPISMKAGVTYTVAAQFANAMDPYTEKAEVKVGLNATADAMTTTVIEPTSIEGGYRSPVDLSGDFTPTANGDYFVGIHAVSDPGTLYLYCYKLDVTANTTGVSQSALQVATVRAAKGVITVANAEGAKVTVVAVNGQVVESAVSAPALLSVSVPAGIYVVTVDGRATKVVVR